jgi:hypothetical protein
MNVITHANAYSLYPYATLVDKRALIIRTGGAGQEIGRAKYADRGWTLVEDLGPAQMTTALFCFSDCEFIAGERYIGDGHTWRIPLPEITLGNDETLPAIPDTLPLNCWRLTYQMDALPELEFDIVDDVKLRYRYAYTTQSMDLVTRIQPFMKLDANEP